MRTANQSEEGEVPNADAGGATQSSEASPIDWSLARSVVSGDRDLLLELVDMFPAESTAQLEAIRDAIAREDAELLSRSAHSLKGMAGYFGAVELVACALRVEQQGRASDIDAARDSIPKLTRELDHLLEALERERVPE